MIPGFESPTALPIVPLGCAIVAFSYYQAQGFKHAGRQISGCTSPADAVAGAIDDSHRNHQPPGPRAFADHPSLRQHVCGRYGHSRVLFACPIGVPIVFLGLHIGVSFLQTYIFVLLTTVYLAGAVAEEH